MPPKYVCIFCDKGLCSCGEDDQAWECDNCPLFHGDSTNWGFHKRCAERNDKEIKDYGEWPRGLWAKSLYIDQVVEKMVKEVSKGGLLDMPL